jgi:hypothetical protein
MAKTATAAHAAKGLPSPSKTACLHCHADGASAPPFALAGTLFADDAATKGAGDAEVRAVDSKGSVAIAHTDAEGNFWVAGRALAPTVHAGARSGAKSALMGTDVPAGDRNDCHDAKFPMVLKP